LRELADDCLYEDEDDEDQKQNQADAFAKSAGEVENF